MPPTPKDLTDPDARSKAHPDDEGTAIFWLIDQNNTYEQLFAPGVTRARAEEIANELNTMNPWQLDAYRWVPDYVADASSLVAARCGGRCNSDLECVNN